MFAAEPSSSSTAAIFPQEQQSSHFVSDKNTHSSAPHEDSSPVHNKTKGLSTYVFISTKLPREPRAWERQAAQPFAPRNEAQKIWRRPPLKNITSENNTKQRRCGNNDDAMRPIKRLKLWQGAEEQENEQTHLRLGYVPTQWGSDRREESHRKRHAADVLQTLLVNATENEKADSPQVKLKPHGSLTEKVEFQSTTTGVTPTEPHQDQQVTIREETVSVQGQYSDNSGMEPDVRPEVEFDLNPEGELASTQNETPFETIATTGLSRSGTGGPAPTSLEAVVDEVFALPCEELLPQEQRSNGPRIDGLLAPTPSRPVTSSHVDDEDTAFLQQFIQRAQEAREKNQTTPLYRPVGDRIKRHLIEQQKNIEPADRKRPHSPEPEDVSGFEEDEATVTTTFPILSVGEVAGQTPSSPNRRSHRLTKLPRPQRPTALPSNISLRRLNGTEFISMAKQRTEAQSAALLVRNNTRKNKDGALSVANRLAQIKQGLMENSHHPESTETSSNSDSSQQQDPQVKKRNIKRRRPNVGGVRWADAIAKFRDDDGEEYTVLTDGDEDGSEKLTAHEYMAKAMTANVAKRGEDGVTPPPEAGNGKSEAATDGVQQPPGSPSSRTRAKVGKASDPSSAMPSIEEVEQKSGVLVAIDTKKRAESNKRKRKQTQGTVNGTPGPSKRSVEVLEAPREPTPATGTQANATRKIRMTRSSRGGTPS